MRYLIIADNHFCEKSSVITGRGDRFSDRLENQIKSLEWTGSFGLPVIHLGDFFNREVLTAEEISCLGVLKEKVNFKEWTFLQGNHGYSGGYDVMHVFEEGLISKPTVQYLDGLKCLWLPFNSTEKDIEGDYDIIFGHIGIKDIPFGAKGFSFEIIDSHCKIFLNGHLHNRYKLGENKWNIGSLTAQNFSDECTQYRKGAVILDTDKKSLEFVENPYAFNFYKFNWSDWISGKISQEVKECMVRMNTCISLNCKEGEKKEIVDSKVFSEAYYLRISEEIKQLQKLDKPAVGSLDYLGKFRKSFIEKYGESPIIFEELGEIVK